MVHGRCSIGAWPVFDWCMAGVRLVHGRCSIGAPTSAHSRRLDPYRTPSQPSRWDFYRRLRSLIGGCLGPNKPNVMHSTLALFWLALVGTCGHRSDCIDNRLSACASVLAQDCEDPWLASKCCAACAASHAQSGSHATLLDGLRFMLYALYSMH